MYIKNYNKFLNEDSNSYKSIVRELNGKTPYIILNVSNVATLEEIKKSRNLLVKQYHPDINPDYNNKIIEINNAYELLSNLEYRKIYDNNITVNNLNNKTQNSQTESPSEFFKKYDKIHRFKIYHKFIYKIIDYVEQNMDDVNIYYNKFNGYYFIEFTITDGKVIETKTYKNQNNIKNIMNLVNKFEKYYKIKIDEFTIHPNGCKLNYKGDFFNT